MLATFCKIGLLFALFVSLAACGDKATTNPTTTTTNPLTTATTTTTPTVAPNADPFEQFVADFKAAAASGDANKMSALCAFPLETGQTQAEFLTEYSNYIDADGKKRISDATSKDWVDAADAKSFSVTQGSGAIIYAKKQGNSYKITAIMMAG
jgi:predicted small lipoprotein YifL